jgi:hypothetical protein
LREQVISLHAVSHRCDELLTQPRLGHEAKNFTLVDRRDHGRQREHGGDQDPRGVWAEAAALNQELEARHLRHPLVRDDYREGSPGENRQRLQGAGARGHVKTFAFERELQRVEHDRLVIDDQNLTSQRRCVRG